MVPIKTNFVSIVDFPVVSIHTKINNTYIDFQLNFPARKREDIWIEIEKESSAEVIGTIRRKEVNGKTSFPGNFHFSATSFMIDSQLWFLLASILSFCVHHTSGWRVRV